MSRGMTVLVGVVVAVVLLAVAPLVMPIAGVVWGVLTLRSVDSTKAEDASRRRRAIGAIVGSLVFAAIIWPLLGGDEDPDELAGTPASTTASPTTSAMPSTPTLSPSPTSAPATPATTPSETPVETPGDEAVVTVTATPSAPAESVDDGVSAASGLVPVVGIIDGDTIKVRVDGRTERVRVIGIDTPELSGDECYARQASSRMQSLAQSRSVRLEADPTQDDRDRYDRLLRHVFLADGRSAAEVLIAGGFGREYTYAADYRYQDRYRAAESAARSASKGLWGSGCADHDASGGDGGGQQQAQDPAPKPAPRVTAQDPAPAAGGCSIKGNINSEGEKIYHVPGGRSYEKTKITQANGERWFCSESEARAAGWRAARG